MDSNGGSIESSTDSASCLFLEPLVNRITTRIARALAASDADGGDDDDTAFCIGSNGGGSGDSDSMISWSSAPPRCTSSSAAAAQVTTLAPALIRQVVVEDGLLPSSVFPAVWRRLESVEVTFTQIQL